MKSFNYRTVYEQIKNLFNIIKSIYVEIRVRILLLFTDHPYLYDWLEARKLFLQGAGHIKEKEYSKGIEVLTQAIDKYSDHFLLYLHRGMAYCVSSKYRNALADFARAVALKPDLNDFFLFFYRGASYHYNGDYELARIDLEKAIALQPDNSGCQHELALVYSSLGDQDRAIQYFKMVIEIDPKFPCVHDDLALAYQEKKDYQSAVKEYSIALKNDPEFSMMINYHLGELFFEMNDLDRALECFDQSIAQEKKQRIEPREDIPDLDQKEFDQMRLELYLARGYTYYLKYKYDLAIADCNEAIRISPENTKAYYQRGYACKEKCDFEKSLSDFGKVIELKPDSFDAWYARACCYAKMGKKEEALKDMYRAMKMDPEKTKKLALDDDDLDGIREEEEFKKLFS